MSKLVNGRIPPRTECSFRSECRFARTHTCNHKGKEHNVEFSCGAARWFDLAKSVEYAQAYKDRNKKDPKG